MQLFKIDLSRWHKRQGKSEGLKSQKIPLTYTPAFMTTHEGEASESTGQVQIRPPVEMLESKKFSLYWADDLTVKETLESLHNTIPSSVVDGPDPRCFFGAEWRDQIRVLYDFQRLNLNFATIVFRWQENDINKDINLLEDDWNKAQGLFGRLPQNEIGRIRFKTRPLEPGEVLYEWSGVPSVLSSYMTSTNGRVEVIEQPVVGSVAPSNEPTHSSDESSGPALSEAALKKSREAQETRNHKDFINQSLAAVAKRLGKRRDPTSGPGMPDPAKGYTSSERSMMLEEHGGVDVTDAKLRGEWTSRMLVKYGASSLRKTSQNVDSTVMALSGAADVSFWTTPTYPSQDHPRLTWLLAPRGRRIGRELENGHGKAAGLLSPQRRPCFGTQASRTRHPPLCHHPWL